MKYNNISWNIYDDFSEQARVKKENQRHSLVHSRPQQPHSIGT